MFFNQIKYKKERVYRVKVIFSNGSISVGSGFFVSKTKFLTCFHVVFGELRILKNDQNFLRLNGDSFHEKCLSLFTNNVSVIQIGSEEGVWVNANLEDFDESYDVTLLSVVQDKNIKICELDVNPAIYHADYVFFGGYPTSIGYDLDKGPFSAHEGIVSSFPEVEICGEKYKHIKINSINLGGNSGAPLFKKNGKKVIGIINGNEWRGNEKIPLSIAYATQIKTLKENSNILKNIK